MVHDSGDGGGVGGGRGVNGSERSMVCLREIPPDNSFGILKNSTS